MEILIIIAKIFGYLLVAFVALTVFLRIYNTFFASRARRIARWGKTVPFSNQQLAAMRSLWQWYKTGNKPLSDPLLLLDPSEMADLDNKVDIEYKPKKLRHPNEVELRSRMMSDLESRGMNDIQAQVVTAMKYCKYGPAK